MDQVYRLQASCQWALPGSCNCSSAAGILGWLWPLRTSSSGCSVSFIDWWSVCPLPRTIKRRRDTGDVSHSCCLQMEDQSLLWAEVIIFPATKSPFSRTSDDHGHPSPPHHPSGSGERHYSFGEVRRASWGTTAIWRGATQRHSDKPVLSSHKALYLPAFKVR